MSTAEYDAAYAARQLSRRRSPLRRLIKGFYLRNLAKDVRGPAIDFGCGAGQLLEQLPSGSVGLEVNNVLVEVLQSQGLNVRLYQPERDQLLFNDMSVGAYQTFVMSHVLEHFEDAADGLNRIICACKRLGIRRVIVVVPGKKGYAFDKTHQSFVNRDYLIRHNLLDCHGYSVTSISYFPFNLEWIGTFLTFHELKIIYDRH
jgi:hypothetical protein